jgi:hypothetical protein
VASDLDDIFGGVGARRGEVGDDDLIDGSAVGVREGGKSGSPGLEFRRFEKLGCDGARVRTRNPNDTDAASAWRG